MACMMGLASGGGNLCVRQGILEREERGQLPELSVWMGRAPAPGSHVDTISILTSVQIPGH